MKTKTTPPKPLDLSYEIAILRDLKRLDADRRKIDRLKPPQPWPEARSLASYADTAMPPRHVSAIQDAIERPMAGAIRTQITIVGWRLYARGGLEAMHAALDAVDDGAFPGRFLSLVDSAWNGIGLDHRGYWWA